METVEEFRARVRAFVQANLHPEDPKSVVGLLRNRYSDEEELAEVARDREIQRAL